MNKPRGRPAGGSDARERILSAARASFLRRGYRATTMRGVADAARVDQALISYYFGSKQGLFGAALSLGVSPGQVLAQVLQGDTEGLPHRILDAVISTWSDPRSGRALTLLVEQLQRDPAMLQTFREYFDRELVARLADRLGGPAATERAAAALNLTLGLIFTRFVLRLGPIATLDSEALVRLLTPSVRAALQGASPRPRPRVMNS